MKQLKDGSIKFVGKKNKVYIFEGKNFKKHYSKHPSIRNEWFLKKVEKTLNAPDVKATDKKKPNTIFYKVIRVFRPGRSVQAIKVVTFWDEKKKRGRIATTFSQLAFPGYVVSQSEKIIWRKPNSLI